MSPPPEHPSAASPPAPPRWKTMIVVWLSIYPLVTLVAAIVGPHIRDLPIPAQTLVMTVLLVPVMSLVMMPLVTRLLAGWLRR